jgi:hypothetical protein
MPVVGRSLRQFGWRSAVLLSPHPPEECRRRLGDAVCGLFSLKLPASGPVRRASAALFWNDDSWTGRGRGALLNLMGQPILRVRWTSQGPGTRLDCDSGLSWVVVGLWAACALFGVVVDRQAHDLSLQALARIGGYVGATTALFLVSIFVGHQDAVARGVEEKLIRYVAEVTDAVPADG